ncbi:MAG: hypothetical protein ABWJ97_05355 [Thermoproteus sp.]
MYFMRGEVPISSLIVAVALLAVSALLILVVSNMGFLAASSLSASASITEQNGVLTASISVLRGALYGVSLIYKAPDGSSWYAKPLYCLANTTIRMTPLGVEFDRPLTEGAAATCGFQLWYPSRGRYGFTLLGAGNRGAVEITTGAVYAVEANKYGGQMPSRELKYSRTGPSLGAVGNSYNYSLVELYWPGRGYLVAEIKWGYTSSTCLADGLYVSFFVPLNFARLVAPSDEGLRVLPFGGADYVPAGAARQIFVQFNPYDGGRYDGSIEFAVMNSSGGVGAILPSGFDRNKDWPNGTWTTYLIYNASSNTLTVQWTVPNVFDVTYSYDLASYGFSVPPAGTYGVAVGVANGGCAANWKIYQYAVASS